MQNDENEDPSERNSVTQNKVPDNTSNKTFTKPNEESKSFFVVLLGDKLRIFSEEPDPTADEIKSPDFLFVIYRKDGFAIMKDNNQSFSLLLQDSKVRAK